MREETFNSLSDAERFMGTLADLGITSRVAPELFKAGSWVVSYTPRSK